MGFWLIDELEFKVYVVWSLQNRSIGIRLLIWITGFSEYNLQYTYLNWIDEWLFIYWILIHCIHNQVTTSNRKLDIELDYFFIYWICLHCMQIQVTVTTHRHYLGSCVKKE